MISPLCMILSLLALGVSPEGSRNTVRSHLQILRVRFLKKPCRQHLGSIIDCQICGLGFGSLQQLNLHMFKAHDVRNPLRVYVSTTHCCVCLKEFHTRERALNHVRYRSATCQSNLLLRGPIITADEATMLEESERAQNRGLSNAGRRRHHASMPAVQLHGPLLPIFTLDEVRGRYHPLGRDHSYLPA